MNINLVLIEKESNGKVRRLDNGRFISEKSVYELGVNPIRLIHNSESIKKTRNHGCYQMANALLLTKKINEKNKLYEAHYYVI